MIDCLVAVIACTAIAALLIYLLNRSKLFGLHSGVADAPADERVILVTGCDSGLGLESARFLAKAGFQVIAGCYLESSVVDGVVFVDDDKERDDINKRILPIRIDVTSEESLLAAQVEINKRFPRGVWGLLSNAGVCSSFLIELTSLKSFEENVDVNYLGTVRVTKLFLPSIRRNRGRVVIVSSFFARGLSPFAMSAYTATKAAVSMFGNCLRQEMSLFGVSVSLIEPGTMKTKMLSKAMTGMTALWNEADEPIQNAYGDSTEYAKVIKRSQLISNLFARSPASVLGSVSHAFTAIYPQSRYLDGFDAWLMGGVGSLLPSFITDTVIWLTVRPPHPPRNHQ